jgi:hypothetical protein
MSVTFTTTLDPDKGPIGITVPEDVMAKLGPAKRYPVVVTLGGHSYRNSVSWYKGAFRIAFSAENRSASGVGPGDTVDVTLELDDAPRVLELPEALREELAQAGVLEKFLTLSYSKQRALVEPWLAAKTDATREKNLAKMVAAAS